MAKRRKITALVHIRSFREIGVRGGFVAFDGGDLRLEVVFDLAAAVPADEDAAANIRYYACFRQKALPKLAAKLRKQGTGER
ncbi:hypothetical protein [Selenomonas bovis]|uniref:hypothetical protein n=1 Tax=Selenomonas bovis TaxID=416586 RepID=UPI00039C8C21|nr:hypothetical protein [Selenomonas bovis]